MYFATGLITRFWPLWLGWILAFMGIEFTALGLRRKFPDTNNSGGTLSELVWWLVRGKQWPHRLALFLFFSFYIDLGFHFFLGTSLFL